MTISIIGIGLIGGSLALSLKQNGFAKKIIGIDDNIEHCNYALQNEIVDEILHISNAIEFSDIVILAIPVDAIVQLLPTLLNQVDKQIITDVGSTKLHIINAVQHHPKRSRYVAAHPMWGTEYSGPQSAIANMFTRKASVICDKESSDTDALDIIQNMYTSLGMHLIFMNAKDHDVHVAYVSHISHITSFALANTVLEKEKEENTIFELASGGFESTVRLAKSNPLTWSSILIENKENILDVLNEHISQLVKFKKGLEETDKEYIADLMKHANRINRILK